MGYNRYNTESFIERVKSLVGDEYSVMGQYIKSSEKICMKHNRCGFEYYVVPNSFICGSRCPKCSGLKKKTTEEFISEVRRLEPVDYSVLGEYINSKTKIRMKHNICGEIFEIKPNSFLSGGRCPECRGNKRLTTEMYREKVARMHGNEYEVVGEVVGGAKKVLMHHNVCGKEYYVAPKVFLQNRGCPYCFKTIPYTTETYKQKVYELTGDRYDVLGEYINSNTKIAMRHKTCGYEYYVRPALFIHGNRCPNCSVNLRRSLPEEIIAYFLRKHKEVIQGYRPEWLKFPSGINGEIDIWLPDIGVGIEYDGIVHASSSNIQKDRIKNEMINGTEFCKILFRIKEIEPEGEKTEGSKVENIILKSRINVGSGVGVRELEKAIDYILDKIGVIHPDTKITKDIISECQNNLEENYKLIGKPIRNRKPNHKKTHAEFCKEVYELVGKEYTVLSEYKTAIDKVEMRHEACGYVYRTKPATFLSGCRCPKCGGTLKMNTEIFVERVNQIVGSEYTVLDEYVNNRTKICMRHNVCNREWKVVPNSFLLGSRCPYCAGSMKMTTEIYKEKVRNKYGDEFTVLSEYSRSKDKILIKHNRCGYQWMVVAGGFLNRGKCPKC